MATIIEIQEHKMEGLCEQAEKVMKHSRKLMECLETLKYSGEHYMERYDKRGGKKRWDREDEEGEYYRY